MIRRGRCDAGLPRQEQPNSDRSSFLHDSEPRPSSLAFAIEAPTIALQLLTRLVSPPAARCAQAAAITGWLQRATISR